MSDRAPGPPPVAAVLRAQLEEPTRRVRRLFVAGLGTVYLCAFGSLWSQIDGLVGSQGLLPAADWLLRVRESIGAPAYWRAPTLLWIDASDAALHLACAFGTVAAVLAAIGVWPRLTLAASWCLYLSLATVGGTFLGYQWDALLLEVGLLAILFAPRRRRGRSVWGAWSLPSPPAALWLLRWLVFRLMFFSGFVKLQSGDPTWRDLSALEYHFFTQPIPAWTSFYVHHMPGVLHSLSVLFTLVVELAIPLLVFGTRRTRQAAFALFLPLQVGIAASGNYGFFNLLTGVLCLVLLDDDALARWIPSGWVRVGVSPGAEASPNSLRRRTGRVGFAIVALMLGAASGVQAFTQLFGRPPQTALVRGMMEGLEPFRSVNRYGLFAVMTTERPEIELEGSRDGEDWKSYEFPWKPGRLDGRPGWIGPHMPRVDWQLWFAALRGCRRATWFGHLQRRLLEGSAPVERLLAENPFPDAPPRYLRSTLYRYRFAAAADESGRWWLRERVGAYCPAVTLVDGRLRPVSRRDPIGGPG